MTRTEIAKFSRENDMVLEVDELDFTLDNPEPTRMTQLFFPKCRHGDRLYEECGLIIPHFALLQTNIRRMWPMSSFGILCKRFVDRYFVFFHSGTIDS